MRLWVNGPSACEYRVELVDKGPRIQIATVNLEPPVQAAFITMGSRSHSAYHLAGCDACADWQRV